MATRSNRSIREIFPSVVLPVSSAAGFFASYLDNAIHVLEGSFDFYEVIVVDDASTDDTVDIVQAKQRVLPNINLFCLPKPHAFALSTIVGLDHAIGDFVIVLAPRLDHPDLVVALVVEALKGTDVVY